jgi:hypothetical protein
MVTAGEGEAGRAEITFPRQYLQATGLLTCEPAAQTGQCPGYCTRRAREASRRVGPCLFFLAALKKIGGFARNERFHGGRRGRRHYRPRQHAAAGLGDRERYPAADLQHGEARRRLPRELTGQRVWRHAATPWRFYRVGGPLCFAKVV